MAKHCEACSLDRRFEHCPKANQRVRNVLIGDRIVQLCDNHARQALEASVPDVEALMQLTRSVGERRSPIDRRGPFDRRMFPPRPEGRRLESTRRQDDDSGAEPDCVREMPLTQLLHLSPDSSPVRLT